MNHRSCLIVMLTILLASVLLKGTPHVSGEQRAGLQLLESSANGVVLQLAVPEYSLEPVALPEGSFQRLKLPGAALTSEPGKPELPVYSTMLGVPADARLELRVLNDAPVTLGEHVWLAPAVQPARTTADLEPGTFVREMDAAAYASAALYPSTVARIGEDAWLRSQRVVRIDVYPFQYIAAEGKLSWHRDLRIAVRWKGQQASSQSSQRSLLPSNASPTRSDPFEATYQAALLNYSDAKAWRVSPQPDGQQQQDSVQMASTFTPTPYKIVADREGLYRLTYADLQAAGLDLDHVDPRTFRLTSRGSDVAIQVSGEGDGRFDSGDTLTFFGQPFLGSTGLDSVVLGGQLVAKTTALSQSYSAATTYTDENVYWLTVGGVGGPRMQRVQGQPIDTAPVPTSFRKTVRAEQSLLWWTTHFTNRDTWFWDRVQTSGTLSRTYTAQLSALAPGALTAAIRGEAVARNHNPNASPDHRTRVTLNDPTVVVEDVTWDGPVRHRFEAQVAQSALREGTNNLNFTVIRQAALSADDIFFDWFEITYDRRFVADADQLVFEGAAAGTWQYEISGFGAPTIEVYDVSNPHTPRSITSTRVTSINSSYRAAFQVTHSTGARYLAVAPSAIQRPKSVAVYSGPDLRAATNGADYVLITHRDFWDSAQRLAAYRRAQGMRTVVVDVADVYNQFNDGIYSPLAIRHFLAYAYAKWQAPAPSYALLVGDGHWNFKGFSTARLGTTPIFMPPNLAWVDPWQGEVESANLLAAVVGDDVMPDLSIGRLPVNTAAEAKAMVDKIISYEAAPTQDWQRRLLFVADNTPDAAGNFTALSETFITDHLPQGFQADRLYLDNECGAPTSPATACPAATNKLIELLNTQGSLLVNYTGHGSISRWAHEQLVVNNNIASLTNNARLPIVLSLSCLDGYWFYPNQPGLTEALVRADQRGAVATFSPTGLGLASGHDELQRGFYAAIFERGVRTFGPATLAGKFALYTTGQHTDLIHTFTIFGDPALRLPVPVVTPSPSPSASPSASPSPSASSSAAKVYVPLVEVAR